MSLHISVISIEGDAREHIAGFLEKCEYKIMGEPTKVSGFDNLGSDFWGSMDKAVAFYNSRTNIIDPELVLFSDEEPLKELSRQFGSVLTMICEGVSSTYAFSVYKNGENVRSVMALEGNIIEQSGQPIPEEKGMNYSEIYEDEILNIMTSLGFDFEGLYTAETFLVYHLDFAGEVNISEEEAKRINEIIRGPQKKPWWKFWL